MLHTLVVIRLSHKALLTIVHLFAYEVIGMIKLPICAKYLIKIQKEFNFTYIILSPIHSLYIGCCGMLVDPHPRRM